jgi:hypothetical protein
MVLICMVFNQLMFQNNNKNYYDFIKEYGGGEYLEPGAVQDIYGKQITDLEGKN